MKPIGHQQAGFALVVTMSIMVMVTLIALAMLTLSSTVIRTQGRSSARDEARANARLALMIAIGELQKHMGPDQRISANGSILGEASVRHPHWLGSWDSWEAGPTSDASPSGGSDHRTIIGTTRTGMRPTYLDRNKHFNKWIVSLDEATAANPKAPLDAVVEGEGDVRPTGISTAVRLVASGGWAWRRIPASMCMPGCSLRPQAASPIGSGTKARRRVSPGIPMPAKAA